MIKLVLVLNIILVAIGLGTFRSGRLPWPLRLAGVALPGTVVTVLLASSGRTAAYVAPGSLVGYLVLGYWLAGRKRDAPASSPGSSAQSADSLSDSSTATIAGLLGRGAGRARVKVARQARATARRAGAGFGEGSRAVDRQVQAGANKLGQRVSAARKRADELVDRGAFEAEGPVYLTVEMALALVALYRAMQEQLYAEAMAQEAARRRAEREWRERQAEEARRRSEYARREQSNPYQEPTRDPYEDRHGRN